jgi:hypothetical protein
VVQIWQDVNLTHIYYSVFDGTSWTAGSAIPLGGISTGVGYGAFSIPVYDNANNQIIEIWQNTGTNGDLFFSIFDGTNWITPASNQVPLGASSGVATQSFATPLYDPAAGKVVVTWQDSVNNLLYYATYNGDWIAPANNLIPLGSSSGVLDYLDPIYDPATGQIIQIWQDSGNNLFYYAFYDGTNWTAPINNLIPMGLSTSLDVRDPVYSSVSGQLLLVWQDFNNNNRLFFSAYSIFPLPPSSFSGEGVKNKFASQTDRVNVLTWTPSTDSSVIYYLLRRNGDLIFVGSAYGPFTYADHNRKKNRIYTYTLTTVNQQGLESSPLTLTMD